MTNVDAIRFETPRDIVAIRRVTEAAFGRANEADLVEALRRDAQPFISLVADRSGQVVGHICFTPVTIGADGRSAGSVGLGPMAVAPELQKQGIGSRLITAGLEECRRQGCTLVVVVGHPTYYPRFGFRTAKLFGLTCEYAVPDDVFMALPLGAEPVPAGMVRYHPAFAEA
jgi:putative acetyltransferase